MTNAQKCVTLTLLLCGTIELHGGKGDLRTQTIAIKQPFAIASQPIRKKHLDKVPMYAQQTMQQQIQLPIPVPMPQVDPTYIDTVQCSLLMNCIIAFREKLKRYQDMDQSDIVQELTAQTNKNVVEKEAELNKLLEHPNSRACILACLEKNFGFYPNLEELKNRINGMNKN